MFEKDTRPAESEAGKAHVGTNARRAVRTFRDRVSIYADKLQPGLMGILSEATARGESRIEVGITAVSMTQEGEDLEIVHPEVSAHADQKARKVIQRLGQHGLRSERDVKAYWALTGEQQDLVFWGQVLKQLKEVSDQLKKFSVSLVESKRSPMIFRLDVAAADKRGRNDKPSQYFLDCSLVDMSE